jgi:ABC-type amino acid transport substrate-binding protein
VKSVFISLFVAAGLAAGGALAQPVPNTLGKIKAAKAINVAFSNDSLPFSFVGPNNEPAGYSIDICKRVIAQIGRAVGEPNLKVNWLAGPVSDRCRWSRRQADLECANTTQTLARLANVDFSISSSWTAVGFSSSPIRRSTAWPTWGQEDRRPQREQPPGPASGDSCSAGWSMRP